MGVLEQMAFCQIVHRTYVFLALMRRRCVFVICRCIQTERLYMLNGVEKLKLNYL